MIMALSLIIFLKVFFLTANIITKNNNVITKFSLNTIFSYYIDRCHGVLPTTETATMTNIDINMIVLNRAINLKNHLAENIPIRLFLSLRFRILAIVINVLAKIKMKNHIL